MLDETVVAALLERYAHLHPLILHRSVERARTLGELFDYLDGFPQTMPVAWDPEERRWNTTDILQTRKPL